MKYQIQLLAILSLALMFSPASFAGDHLTSQLPRSVRQKANRFGRGEVVEMPFKDSKRRKLYAQLVDASSSGGDEGSSEEASDEVPSQWSLALKLIGGIEGYNYNQGVVGDGGVLIGPKHCFQAQEGGDFNSDCTVIGLTAEVGVGTRGMRMSAGAEVRRPGFGAQLKYTIYQVEKSDNNAVKEILAGPEFTYYFSPDTNIDLNLSIAHFFGTIGILWKLGETGDSDFVSNYNPNEKKWYEKVRPSIAAGVHF